ncbi:substrate-binding periplasmic protein [Roseateles sp.]|uniref:substrate-binding periplasmic protein n=1 Tax=Roseateles sp. TaxID=1971397 RepID=UPI003BA5EEAF
MSGRKLLRAVLFLLFSAPVLAQPQPQVIKPGVPSGPANRLPALTVHLVSEESPFVYAQGGKVAGPATDILERVMEDAGIAAYDFKIYPWARAYDLALKQPNVLIYLIARTPEREARFKWVGELTRLDIDFYRLKSRPEIQLRSLAEARQYKVGVVRDDVRHQYLSLQGFNKLLVESRLADNLRQLLGGRVDLVALTEADYVNLCKHEFAECAQLERVYRLEDLSTSLQAAFSVSTPDEVVERVRQSFDKLKARGKIKL